MEPQSQVASLRLSRILVPVRIGWEDDERRETQPIAVDVDLGFGRPPEACRTDRISDTVDYADIVRCVVATAAAGEYRLVERFTQQVFDDLRRLLPTAMPLSVTVTKHPVLPGLEGGASFRIGDWPAHP